MKKEAAMAVGVLGHDLCKEWKQSLCGHPGPLEHTGKKGTFLDQQGGAQSTGAWATENELPAVAMA